MIAIKVLGRLQVFRDGQEVELRSQTMRELICYLAINYQNGSHRDRLVEAIWPDVDQQTARRRLSQSLWRLTTRLPGLKIERSQAGSIRLDLGSELLLDLAQFDAVLAHATVTLDPSDVVQALEIFESLAPSEGGEWLVAERQRLLNSCGDLCRSGIRSCMSNGDTDGATRIAEQSLLRAPFDDHAMQQLLKLHLSLGTYSAGIDHYVAFRSRMRNQLSSEPHPSTIELADQLVSRRLLSERHADTANIVGRASELHIISEAMARSLISGAGQSITLVGEPGIGKTALAETAATAAESLGLMVLFVEHSPRSSDQPYGGLKWVLAQSLRGTEGKRCLEALDVRWQAPAINVLPNLEGSGTKPTPATLKPAEEVWRQREAIAQIVLTHARLQPTLLILDDVQWADTETEAVVDRLLHSVDDLPLVLVQTRRPTASIDSGEPIPDDSSSPDDTSTLIKLEELDRKCSAELAIRVASTPLTPARVDQIVAAADGNPLFIVELSKSAGHSRRLTGPIQPTLVLSKLIRGQVDQMPSHMRRAAEALAIVHVPLSGRAVAALTRSSRRTASDALQALCELSVAEETAHGYRLRHDIFRSSIENDLDELSRTNLHRQAVAILTNLELAPAPTPWHEIAAHAHHSGDARTEFTARLNAAESASQEHSPEVATRHLSQALKLDPGIIPRSELVRALLKLDALLAILGKHHKRHSVLKRCQLLTASEPANSAASLRIDVWRRKVDAFTQQSRFDEALRNLSELRIGDEELLEDERRFMEGRILHLAGRSDEAIPLLSHSTTIHGHARSDLDLDRLMTLGSALWSMQQFEEATETLRRALHLCETTEAPRQLVDVLGHLATLAGSQGRIDEASVLHARATSVASRIGYRRGEAINLVNLATTLAMAARGGAAMMLYDEAEAVFQSISDERGVAFVRLNRGEARLWLVEDHDGAERDAKAASQFFQAINDRRHLSSTADLRANVRRVRGQLADAETFAAEALQMAVDADDRFLEAQALRTCARVALACDQFDKALDFSAEAIEICEVHGFVQLTPFLNATSASASHALGDFEASRLLLDDLSRFDLTTSSLRHEVAFAAAEIAEDLGAIEAALIYGSQAVGFLIESLEGLSPDSRRKPPNLAAMQSWLRTRTGVTVSSTVPSAAGRTGRGFSGFATVEWAVEEPSDNAITDPVQRRRNQLRRLRRQAEHEGAAPRRSDLAALLDVSEATIKRDLRAIRADQSSAEAAIDRSA